MQSNMNPQAIEVDAFTNVLEPAGPRRRRYGRDAAFRGKRGSAIILVIVSIVLLAILGATMVQVARFERLSETQNNIDVVVASVLDLIAIRLGEDLTDDNGNFFNPGGTAATGGFDEPYDYPWTRPDTNGQFQAERIDGSTVVVWGGAFDDMWLASNELNASNQWPHITNLTGLFLDAGGNADLSNQGAPNERLVNGVEATDTGLAFNAAFLVDADGDGIGDSRWAWAPIKQIGGTRYAMAVRIIDLSSRVDLNVALAQLHNPAGTAADGIPRGDNPAELDGGAAAIALGANSNPVVPAGTALAEWEATMAYRLSGNASNTFATFVPYGDRNTPLTRQHYGFRGAAQVNNSFGRSGMATDGSTYDYTSTYSQSSAFELLRNGGLASPAGSPIETHMPNLLRDGANETTYTIFGTEQQYFANNPRLYFSPFTGAGIFARPAEADNSQFTTLGAQVDVNKADPDDLGQAILDILGNTTTPLTLPHLASATAVSDQLAANLKDFSDEDNWVSQAGSQFGFEALPMITEVYSEREYVLLSSTDTSGSGAGPWNTVWRQNGTTVSYMIEISNPYHRPITLQDVQLRIRNAEVIHTGTTATSDLAFLAGQPSLGPGESIILYHDGTGSGSPSMSTAVDGGHTGPTPALINDTWTPSATTIQVTLHAKQDTTDDAFDTAATAATWMDEPYQVVETVGMPPQYPQDGLTVDPALTPSGINGGVLQVSAQGNGNGLNALHVTSAEFFASGDGNKLEPASTVVGSAPGNDAIGSTAKGGGKVNVAQFTAQQIVHQDRPMKYIGDLLMVPIFGFEASVPMATQLETSGVVASGSRVLEQLMLPYVGPAASVPRVSTAPTLNYPHSVILMDRLTVSSPLEDDEDNNNDGTIDDEGEFLLPGRINLNTASEALLQRVLPYPDQATRDVVAARIVNRREQANKASSGVAMGDDNSRGIAYIGELYGTIRNQTGTHTDGETLVVGGHVDWNDYEITTAAGDYNIGGNEYVADNIPDDREEEIMLAKWLNEVGSTRSDIFAAYIIVQGYPAGDFTAGATESAKLIALFSRTNIRGGGQKAQVLGVLRIE